MAYLFLFIDAFRIKSYIQPFYFAEQCFYRIEKRNKTITEMLLYGYLARTHKRYHFILCFQAFVNYRINCVLRLSVGINVNFPINCDKFLDNNVNVSISMDFPLFVQLKFLSIQQHLLTCFSNKSLLADRQVTRYFVKLKNELSTSSVKCSRDDLCNMNDITRNPRFCKKKPIFRG